MELMEYKLPLPRSLSSPVPGSPQHKSSSMRRRAKSPGRRLTDSNVRSDSGIDCTAASTPTKLKTLSLSNIFTSRLMNMKKETSDKRRHSVVDGNTHNSLMAVDGSSSVACSDDNNDVFDNEMQPCYSNGHISNKPLAHSSFRAPKNLVITADEADESDESPVKKRMKIDPNGLASNRSSRRGGPSSNSTSKKTGYCSAFFQFIFSLICLVLTVAFLAFSLSFCLIWMRSRCEELQHSKFDLVGITESLTKRIIGQDLAIQQIASLLEKFNEEQFTEPNIMWCVGWSGNGKSKSMDVLKHSIASQAHVQYLLPTFLPSSDEALQLVVNQTVARMNPCLKDVVIVDGWDDKEDDVVLRFVHTLLKTVKRRSSEEDVNMNHLLVIVVGVRGSMVINREYLAQNLQDRTREQLTLDLFSDIMRRTDEYDDISALGPLTIVPFLPLETSQVKECVKRELVYFRKLVKDGLVTLGGESGDLSHESDEAIADTVVGRLSFMPKDAPLMSSSGCKRVLSALRMVLGDVDAQPTLD